MSRRKDRGQKRGQTDFPDDPLVENLPTNEGTQVRSLLQEDPMCCRATEPMSHND